jgi:fibronectin-binding autotransporter adhesin
MATKYWVGGSGTWNLSSTVNWSYTSGGTGGAPVPNSSDDVIFDQAGTYGITMTGTATIATLVVSAASSYTFRNGTSPALIITAGTLNLATGTTWNCTGALTLGGSGTVTTNAVLIRSGTITINTAGTITLGSALTTLSTSYFYHTLGTLALAGYTLTAGYYSSTNANTRSIDFGTNGKIYLIWNVLNSIVLSMGTITNFTWAGTGGFYLNANIAKSIVIGQSGGGNAYNAPNLYVYAGSGTLSTSSSWFNILDFTGFTGSVASGSVNFNTLILPTTGSFPLTVNFIGTGGTYTSNSRIITALNINSAPNGTLSIGSPLSTNADIPSVTLTQGTLDLNGHDLSTNTFISSNTNIRSINFGANKITLGVGVGGNVLSMGTATNFTCSGTGGFTTLSATGSKTHTFGNTAGGSSSNAPNLNILGGTVPHTLSTGSYFGILDFTGPTSYNSVNTTAINVNSLILSAHPSATTAYRSMSITAVGTGTINTNNRAIPAFTVNAPNGVVTLVNDLTILNSTNTAGPVILTAGTLDINNYTLNAATFDSTGGTSRALVLGTGILNISGSSFFAPASPELTTPTSGTINLTSANIKIFTGGSASWPTLNQGGIGTLVIAGSNTFANITNTVQPTSILFTAGTTSTFTNFSLAGTQGNLVTISSSTTIPHTLTMAMGRANSSYLNISYSNATGGAIWNARSSSTDSGNNSGWIFSDPSTFFLVF